MSYAKSADAALEYLAARVLNASWVSKHDDVAYYFKAPMAFVEAGRMEEAKKALDVAERYLSKGGAGSGNPAYDGVYPHYPWMWLCWAAARLGRADLADQCFQSFCPYMHPMKAGLVTVPFCEGKRFEADFFATAEVAKFAMLHGDVPLAGAAADVLLRALAANRQNMERGRFYLRWSSMDQETIKLNEVEDVFHCVLKDQPGQLYFMMAFPGMVLFELARHDGASSLTTSSQAYIKGATDLLEYLKNCTGAWQSPMSHKTMRLAAMARDTEAAAKLANFFASQQQSAGCFQADLEAMDSVDQTAEIAVWLQQVERDLSTPTA